MEVKKIKLSDIEVDKNQPRKEFENIGELASSILKEGLLEPLKVEKNKEKYLLIDGERRYWALDSIRKRHKDYPEEVDCIVMPRKKQRIFTQLITDLQKNKLSPFEEADAFKKLIESGMDIDELRVRLVVPRTYIVQRLKLLGLSERTKELIRTKKIPFSLITSLGIDAIKAKEAIIVSRIAREKPRGKEVIKIVREEAMSKYGKLFDRFVINLDSFNKDLKKAISQMPSEFIAPDLRNYLGKKVGDSLAHLNQMSKDVERLVKVKSGLDEVMRELEDVKKKYGLNQILNLEVIRLK